MGGRASRKSLKLTKAPTNGQRNIAVKHAIKKKVSKDRAARVRDALNRDMDLLYSAMENPPAAPFPVLKADSVVSLVEGMQRLGKS